MTVAVVTASYGAFDHVRPQIDQDIDVEWWCFTDAPDDVPAPWRTVHEPRPEPPRLAAKRYKMTPTLEGFTDVVWIDANMQVTSHGFARAVLHARHDGVAVWRHPRRDCIYTEADASVGAEGQDGKYADQPIAEQVAHYRAHGYPEHAGLYACGTVAWDFGQPRAVELGRLWLEECTRWSIQDQLSLPYACRALGVVPGVFPVHQIEHSRPGWLENRWLRIHPHQR